MAFEGICEIRRAGVDSNGLARLDLKADNGQFDWNWFFSQPEVSREVLATALAAIVSGKRLNCLINDPVVPNGRIVNIQLIK
jgi:hypothetical protein